MYTQLVCRWHKTGRRSDTSESCAAMPRRGADRLEGWDDRRPMNPSKEKCQVLHLGRNSPTHQCMLRDTHLESNWAENALGFPAERESVMCLCSKCYWYPGLHYTTYSQQINRSDPVSLRSTAETTPGVLYPVLGFAVQERHGCDR